MKININKTRSWNKKTKATVLTICMLGFAFTQELEIEGNLRVNGEIIFADSTSMISAIPKGVVVMWSGTIGLIPDGWALCDGANGTPNLLDKFVMGVSDINTDPGEEGGDSLATLPEHTHSFSGTTTEKAGDYYYYYHTGGSPKSTGTHTHDYSGVTDSTSVATIRILPPYFKIAFIIKL